MPMRISAALATKARCYGRESGQCMEQLSNGKERICSGMGGQDFCPPANPKYLHPCKY
jgi:hypothetical protein